MKPPPCAPAAVNRDRQAGRCRRVRQTHWLPSVALHHGTTVLEVGADLRFMQARLGHVDLSAKKIYTQVAIRKAKPMDARGCQTPAHGRPDGPGRGRGLTRTAPRWRSWTPRRRGRRGREMTGDRRADDGRVGNTRKSRPQAASRLLGITAQRAGHTEESSNHAALRAPRRCVWCIGVRLLKN
jgi:hypothetical protein